MQQVSIKAIIIRDGKVLMVKDTKGLWELPGGRLKFGETPEQALKREIQEELSLEITDISPIKNVLTFCTNKNDISKQYLVLFYECKVNDSVIKLDDESVTYEWVSLDKCIEYPACDIYHQILSQYQE